MTTRFHEKVEAMSYLPRLITAAMLLAGSAASAQTSVTLAGQTATATVLQGLTLTNTAALNFGRIVNAVTAGTAIMSTGGVVSVTGGVTAAPAGGPSTGNFTVTGTTGNAINITLPGAPITLTSGANTMTVTAFTNSAGANPVAFTSPLAFRIGGTLNVGANQAPGAYTGTYSVTVAYN
jgi:Mat/Ecp fimbriae major subunit